MSSSQHIDDAVASYRHALEALKVAEIATAEASSKLTDAETALSEAGTAEMKARNEVKRMRRELDTVLVGVLADD
jgi:hypothetical protein